MPRQSFGGGGLKTKPARTLYAGGDPMVYTSHLGIPARTTDIVQSGGLRPPGARAQNDTIILKFLHVQLLLITINYSKFLISIITFYDIK
ncbi:MAG: hypothetical protein V1860_03910 [bacterium]